jgi:hypothetical protein
MWIFSRAAFLMAAIVPGILKFASILKAEKNLPADRHPTMVLCYGHTDRLVYL